MKRWTGKFLKKLKCHVQLLHHDLASRPKKIYFYDKYGCANKKEGKNKKEDALFRSFLDILEVIDVTYFDCYNMRQ